MKTLLAVLLQIRNNVESGKHNPECGICHQDVMDRSLQDENYELMAGWPEHSGWLTYPVRSCTPRTNNARAYRHAADKWVGEYGAARLRLLDWCINELESRDANHPER